MPRKSVLPLHWRSGTMMAGSSRLASDSSAIEARYPPKNASDLSRYATFEMIEADWRKLLLSPEPKQQVP